MDFGRRLQGSKPVFQRPKVAQAETTYQNVRAFVGTWKFVLLALCCGALLYSLAPLHFSTGHPCHSVLKGLRNRAFSRHMQEFSLAHCGIADFPLELYEFRGLKMLDLAGNSLSTLPEDFGVHFPELEILFLSENQFSGAFTLQKALTGLKKLRMLAFRGNELTSVPENAFPESLEWLILTSNKLTSVGRLPNKMRKLMLSNNALKTMPEKWEELKNLELLRVANNLISRPLLESVATKLPNVKWLAAADNPTPMDLWTAPEIPALVLKDSDAKSLIASLSKGRFLGEGSAGQSYLVDFNGEPVIYKKFKKLLSTDGRIETELIHAALVAPKDDKSNSAQLQQIRGITKTPLGVIYSHPESKHGSVGKPPSFTSVTRDTYDSKKAYTPHVARRILSDVAKGLERLHEKKVIHGDLYGHNVQYHPETGEAMVIDLGAAWQFESPAVAQVDFRAFWVLAEELMARLAPHDPSIQQGFAVMAQKDTTSWPDIIAYFDGTTEEESRKKH